MTTEAKIREAFEKYRYRCNDPYSYSNSFEAGYMALLNELDPVECRLDPDDAQDTEVLYRLPEGVEKL